MLPTSSNPFLINSDLYSNAFDPQNVGVFKDQFTASESLDGHIYKANKLKMTKHAPVSKAFVAGSDISQDFRSGIQCLPVQRSVNQPYICKKRKAEETYPNYCKMQLPALSSSVALMPPVLPTHPFINQNIFNHFNAGNRANNFLRQQTFNNPTRSNGFQQLTANYDGFHFNQTANDSPSYPALLNPVSIVKNLPAPNTSSKVNINSTAKSSTRSAASDGDYNIVVGEPLYSNNEIYEVLSFLGRGTFGQVVKCRCHASNRIVAIKILKNHPSYLRQGNVEVQILQTLSQHDTEAHNIVRAIECFQHRSHMCLVFELLEQNLYEFLKSNNFRPLDLREIRPIAQQVLTALSKLRSLGLIHADLKPENIMLVCPTDGIMRYRVKVIDFGSACHSSKAMQNTYLQSRYYRAPEILLGLPFNEAIDMWSLGCVIAELFLGWPLYPGSSEYDQIRYIVETQGLPPPDLLKAASKANRFFIYDSCCMEWRLKTQEEYASEMNQRAKETRKYIFNSLEQIRDVTLNTASGSPVGIFDELDARLEGSDRAYFTDLLRQMLQLRSSDRILPDMALHHEFITIPYMRNFITKKRVRDSMELMSVCYPAYRNQHNGIGAVNSIQQHLQEQVLVDEALAAQQIHPTVPLPAFLAFGGSPNDSVRPIDPNYYVPTQKRDMKVSSPVTYSHLQQQQQQAILQHNQQAPPTQQQMVCSQPSNANMLKFYDQLLAAASPYAVQQAPLHQNVAAIAAMQSALMGGNGASPSKTFAQNRLPTNGDANMAAIAAVAKCLLVPGNHQQPVQQLQPAFDYPNQKINSLVNYLSGALQDTNVETHLQRNQPIRRLGPDDLSSLFAPPPAAASSSGAVQQHQHHPVVVAPSFVASQQSAELVNNAAAVSNSLRQLILNNGGRSNDLEAGQLLLENLVRCQQQQQQQVNPPSGYFTGGQDFNLPPDLYSQLVRLENQAQASYYAQKGSSLNCFGDQNINTTNQHFHTSHQMDAAPRTQQQRQQQLFLQDITQRSVLYNSSVVPKQDHHQQLQQQQMKATISTTQPQQIPSQSSTSISSSPRGDVDKGRNETDNTAPAFIQEALQFPTAVCSGERPGPPGEMGATTVEAVIGSREKPIEVLDISGEDDEYQQEEEDQGNNAVVTSTTAKGDYDDTDIISVYAEKAPKSSPKIADGSEAASVDQEPTSLIYRPDKKIPVGRVQPMKKTECDEGAYFAQSHLQTKFGPAVSAYSNAFDNVALFLNGTHPPVHPSGLPIPPNYVQNHPHRAQQQQVFNEAYRNLILLHQFNLSNAAAAQFFSAGAAYSTAAAAAAAAAAATTAKVPDVPSGGDTSLDSLTANLVAIAAYIAASGNGASDRVNDINSETCSNFDSSRSRYL